MLTIIGELLYYVVVAIIVVLSIIVAGVGIIQYYFQAKTKYIATVLGAFGEILGQIGKLVQKPIDPYFKKEETKNG